MPRLAEADLVVTAAQIPGKASPTLITETMVDAMRPGSLVIDLSIQRGGNCTLTRVDQEVDHQGVTILGPTDLASGSPVTASRMFASNIVNLVRHLVVDDALVVDSTDEITSSMLVAAGGSIVHPDVHRVLEDLGDSEAVKGTES